jgi:hypothetical protein
MSQTTDKQHAIHMFAQLFALCFGRALTAVTLTFKLMGEARGNNIISQARPIADDIGKWNRLPVPGGN